MEKQTVNKFLATHIVKAFYNWCLDNDYTPMMQVSISMSCTLPNNLYNMKDIVLNLSPMACRNLVIDDTGCSLTTRFNGVPWDILVPIDHIQHISAKEISFIFDIKPFVDMITQDDLNAQQESKNINDLDKKANKAKAEEKPKLKIVGGQNHIKPKEISLNQNKDVSRLYQTSPTVESKDYSLGLPAEAIKETTKNGKTSDNARPKLKLVVIDGGKK